MKPNLIKKILNVLKNWMERQWNEGTDMHNRHQALVDERYAKNFYWIRGGL